MLYSIYLPLFVFRHEVPVSCDKIKIIHIDDDLVVVNKPASIPVRHYAKNFCAQSTNNLPENDLKSTCCLTKCFLWKGKKKDTKSQVPFWLLIHYAQRDRREIFPNSCFQNTTFGSEGGMIRLADLKNFQVFQWIENFSRRLLISRLWREIKGNNLWKGET